MSIIKTLDRGDIAREFFRYGRHDQFSDTGLAALVDYYEQLAEDIGQPIELDVIQWCVEWWELDGTELNQEYGYIMEDAGIDEWDTSELVEELRNHTTVLDTGEGTYLMQEF